MRIKVCGVNDEATFQELVALPVDYVGFIFYKPSPRCFSEHFVPQGKVQKVGVFVNESLDFIRSKMEAFGLDIVQLHGQETEELALQLQQHGPVWKAVAVKDEKDIAEAVRWNAIVDRVVLDTKGPLVGGNGKPFRWGLLKDWAGKPPLLAGGIGPGSGLEIKQVKDVIWGVDLNSKFEIEPGLKDCSAIKQLKDELEGE